MRRSVAAAGPVEELVYGVRPVQELLTARPRRVERLLVARETGPRLGRLMREVREAGIPVSYVPRTVLDRRVGRGGTHQGVAAVVAPVDYTAADEVCRLAEQRPDGLLVLLQGVTDSGNLGAIARSAAAAGAQGLLLATEGTAGITAAAMKASAGTLARLPVAREPRPQKRLDALRQAGFRAVLLDPRGQTPWDRGLLEGRLAVVAGGEERGVRPAVARACDLRISIPLAEGVESLNVAVATGVLLFEIVRRRRRGGGDP